MLRRRLLYVIPILTALVVCVVLLGPGEARKVSAVRVYATGPEIHAIRLVTLDRYEGNEAPRGLDPLSVWVSGESSPRWTGATPPDGVVEVVLEPPLEDGAAIRITSKDDVLLDGPLKVGTTEAARLEDNAVAAQLHAGDAIVRVTPARGVLVPPFSEDVAVSVTRNGAPVDARIKLSALSADLASTTLQTGASGEVTFSLTPLAQPVLLTLELRSVGLTEEVDATLPVEMSGMYIEPRFEDGHIVVVSPGPRDRAFVSFHDARGRIGGAIVPLEADTRGFFRGTVDAVPPEGTLAVVVSGEPTEKGPSTVAWPVPGQRGRARAPTLSMAIDGTKPRVEKERRRVSIVRTITVLGLCAAAALELVLLLWTGQREKKRLRDLSIALDRERLDSSENEGTLEENAAGSEAHSEAAGGSVSIAVNQRVMLVTVCALVILSFVTIAALVLR